MTNPRVLISDSMSSQAAAIFEERGVEVVQSSKLSEAELLDMIGDFDGLAIRSSTKVTEELLQQARMIRQFHHGPEDGRDCAGTYLVPQACGINRVGKIGRAAYPVDERIEKMLGIIPPILESLSAEKTVFGAEVSLDVREAQY